MVHFFDDAAACGECIDLDAECAEIEREARIRQHSVHARRNAVPADFALYGKQRTGFNRNAR